VDVRREEVRAPEQDLASVDEVLRIEPDRPPPAAGVLSVGLRRAAPRALKNRSPMVDPFTSPIVPAKL
jgi:hypothetical protein